VLKWQLRIKGQRGVTTCNPVPWLFVNDVGYRTEPGIITHDSKRRLPLAMPTPNLQKVNAAIFKMTQQIMSMHNEQ
jgi:hypothetical protein